MAQSVGMVGLKIARRLFFTMIGANLTPVDLKISESWNPSIAITSVNNNKFPFGEGERVNIQDKMGENEPEETRFASPWVCTYMVATNAKTGQPIRVPRTRDEEKIEIYTTAGAQPPPSSLSPSNSAQHAKPPPSSLSPSNYLQPSPPSLQPMWGMDVQKNFKGIPQNKVPWDLVVTNNSERIKLGDIEDDIEKELRIIDSVIPFLVNGEFVWPKDRQSANSDAVVGDTASVVSSGSGSKRSLHESRSSDSSKGKEEKGVEKEELTQEEGGESPAKKRKLDVVNKEPEKPSQETEKPAETEEEESIEET